LKTGLEFLEFLKVNKGKTVRINNDFEIQVYNDSPKQAAVHNGDYAIIKIQEEAPDVLTIYLQNPDDIHAIYYRNSCKINSSDKITKIFEHFEDHQNIEKVMAALFLLK